MVSKICLQVFEKSILDYHVFDDISKESNNPYNKNQLEFLLYQKNWIDTVHWHLEDIIRDPKIDPVEALKSNVLLTYQIKNEPTLLNTLIIFWKK